MRRTHVLKTGGKVTLFWGGGGGCLISPVSLLVALVSGGHKNSDFSAFCAVSLQRKCTGIIVKVGISRESWVRFLTMLQAGKYWEHFILSSDVDGKIA